MLYEVITGSSVVHSFNHYGNYGVTATVTNRCGLSASVTDSFSIQPGLQARAEFDYYFENGENCPESPVHVITSYSIHYTKLYECCRGNIQRKNIHRIV